MWSFVPRDMAVSSPCHKSPTRLGSILGLLLFGNSHIPKKASSPQFEATLAHGLLEDVVASLFGLIDLPSTTVVR